MPVSQPAARTASSSVSSSSVPTQLRTGALKNPIIKHSSAQTAKLNEAREAFWREYKAAHKAATLELSESRRLCSQRKVGHRPVDIATKHDNTLSPDNPHRITVSAIRNWLAKNKKPGTSPQLPGPKQDKAKAALIAAVGSYSQLYQATHGQASKPKELIGLVMAAVEGTL